MEKNQDQQNTIDDLEAQTDDNLQTIRDLNEENQTAKIQNRELHKENESLKTEIENLKQHMEDLKEANRSNRRNNTPNTENATTEIEGILLLTDSYGTRVMEHITNRKKIKHITTYRMEDVVAYTESRKRLNRPVYIMVGTNDILDGKPAEDLLETLKTATHQLESHNLQYKIIQLPPNRTSTEAAHETICYNRIITKVFPNNTINTSEPYKTPEPLGKDNIHLTPEGAKIVAKELENRMIRRNLTQPPRQDNTRTREETQQPPNNRQQPTTSVNNTTTMSIRSEYTGRVIGKRGENKQRMQTKHQTYIRIEDKGDEAKITITGPSKNCQDTKQEIQEIIEKARSDKENKSRKQQKQNNEQCRNRPNCRVGYKCWYRHDPQPTNQRDTQQNSSDREPPHTHDRRENRKERRSKSTLREERRHTRQDSESPSPTRKHRSRSRTHTNERRKSPYERDRTRSRSPYQTQRKQQQDRRHQDHDRHHKYNRTKTERTLQRIEAPLLQRHWCQNPKHPPNHPEKTPLRTTPRKRPLRTPKKNPLTTPQTTGENWKGATGTTTKPR